MKLATLYSEHADGRLVVVSRDLQSMADATAIAPHLCDAVARWDQVAPALQQLYDALNAGRCAQALPFDSPAMQRTAAARAAMVRRLGLSEPWPADGKAFNTEPQPDALTVPLMYQGASDDFLGPQADVALPSEADGIDFEGEFGVVVAAVPMGATPAQALAAVRLLVQINDWSLRALGPREMRTGFGFLQAKPSSSFAPIALTPDELGPAWRDGRVQMRLQVQWNGAHFGAPHGGEMNFGFGELIAHAARTRRLSAGTVIGSGTVSNVDRAAGSACIAERRVLEIIDEGAARTRFMQFGDSVRMQAQFDGSDEAPFGAIAQRVVEARP